MKLFINVFVYLLSGGTTFHTW